MEKRYTNAELRPEPERKSAVVTFVNHPPVRIYGECIWEWSASNSEWYSLLGIWRCAEEVWSRDQRWGHCVLARYKCRSGKYLYFGSYYSGSENSRTVRTYLQDETAIRRWLSEETGDEAAWYACCGRVNPALILDSEKM